MKPLRPLHAVAALSTLLFALAGPTPDAVAWPCQEDIETFCQGVVPGSGRLDRCLREHQEEISQECREVRLGIRDKVYGFVDACAEDVKRLCGNVAGGDARIARCLKAHEAELSPVCRDRADALKELMGKGNPCYADQERFCGNVVPGEGRILECMLEYRPDLSEGCNAYIEDTLLRVKEKVTEEVQGFMDACRGDIQKYCRGLAPGQGRLVKCLEAHEKDLSETCRQRLKP